MEDLWLPFTLLVPVLIAFALVSALSAVPLQNSISEETWLVWNWSCGTC